MKLSAIRKVSVVIGLMLLGLSVTQSSDADEIAFPLKAKRVLFLGDSITHSGGYIANIEAQTRLHGVEPLPEFFNLGLGSETCSGLSEPKHPFPRPCVHGRLEKTLQRLKPDVVVACYGMNDGIYYPLGEERFQAYKDGVNLLIEKVHATGAKLVLLTPPPYDPVPVRDKGKLKPLGEEEYAYFAVYEDYNDVLAAYGHWILEQKDRVEMVIDVHTPFMNKLAEERKTNPTFTLSPDSIHPNAEGHKLLSETILAAWGIESTVTPSAELMKLMTQKTRTRHDAWLNAIGHEHPRVKGGLPVDEAEANVKQLDEQIEALFEKP